MQIIGHLCCLVFFLLPFCSFGQQNDRIELVRADELEGGTYRGEPVRKLRGNVVFRQNDVTMYCDSAYQYTRKNEIEAFSNVRINQADTIHLTGNRLTYNGETRKAVVRENVVLRDPQMTLTTNHLEYNTRTKIAYYPNRGTIVDGNNTLTSRQGYYDTNTRLFRFRQNVRVENPTENFILESDTLHYSTATKIATFHGPTKITSETGVLFANEGEYNTVTAEYDFAEQATIETDQHIISGDRIHFDERRDVTVITNNVRLMSPQDSIIIESDHAHHWGNLGIAKVYGNVLLKQFSGGDTLYLTADTLISIDRKDNSEKKLQAFHNARIFKSDLQAIADSLIYDFADSTIYFYQDPVMWSDESQISGDSINIMMVNNNVDRMHVNQNSFIISQDTIFNFNQIKGRNMTAFFIQNKINRVKVIGNAESIYHALEGDTSLVGMNKAICSEMMIRFADNKLQTISFLTNPEASFIPPHEISEPERKLNGFMWRLNERPSRESLVGIRERN